MWCCSAQWGAPQAERATGGEMYDIEGKLRRRAMLERLTGLGRAEEATTNSLAPPVPDQAPRPRHRNDPPADQPISETLQRRLLSPERAEQTHQAEEPDAAPLIQDASGEGADRSDPVAG